MEAAVNSRMNARQLLALGLFSVTVLGFAGIAEAKVFRNAYVAFELPDRWKCVLEHTEWVCRSEQEKESREAIIILTAKEVGPTDSFDAYASHLNTAQSVAYRGQGAGTSRIIYAPKKVRINDHDWIDGLHLASEVPNYFTRYLATIKDKIAILVTFSAHKDFYSKYSQDFYRAVMSLRVIATKNLLAQPDLGPIRPGGESLGGPISAVMPSDMAGTEADGAEFNSGGGKMKWVLILLAAALAGGGFVMYKRSKG